jgi:hypothetical protein
MKKERGKRDGDERRAGKGMRVGKERRENRGKVGAERWLVGYLPIIHAHKIGREGGD